MGPRAGGSLPADSSAPPSPKESSLLEVSLKADDFFHFFRFFPFNAHVREIREINIFKSKHLLYKHAHREQERGPSR